MKTVQADVMRAKEVTEYGQTVQDWENAATVKTVSVRVQPVATNPFTRQDIAQIDDISRLARMRLMFYRGELDLTPGWNRVVVNSKTYDVRNHSQWPRHSETVLEEVV